ncbi:DinB family protein [Paenibacillus sp. GCM10027627]|uniref:DinB family protein n=1 Tax=unclassified Paenibacillus TaxID=185978 RepID=UPI003639E8D2
MSTRSVQIESYLHTYNQLAEAVEGLPDEALRWKAAPNVWSVTEVLAHLADHHIVVSFRIRELLAQSTVRFPAFQQDAWVAGQQANEGDARDHLNAFHALLVYNSLLLKRLEPEQWELTGVNAKGETVTLDTIIKLFIGHVQTHLAQIARIRQGESESKGSSCAI